MLRGWMNIPGVGRGRLRWMRLTTGEYCHGLRDDDASLLQSAQKAAMGRVWDNPEDEVWNDVRTR